MNASNIRDNKTKETSVGAFLEKNIKESSTLSFVSAYFTIYAYKFLKDKLESISSLRFLFGEPNFILDPNKSSAKNFSLTESSLFLNNRLEQKK